MVKQHHNRDNHDKNLIIEDQEIFIQFEVL